MSLVALTATAASILSRLNPNKGIADEYWAGHKDEVRIYMNKDKWNVSGKCSIIVFGNLSWNEYLALVCVLASTWICEFHRVRARARDYSTSFCLMWVRFTADRAPNLNVKYCVDIRWAIVINRWGKTRHHYYHLYLDNPFACSSPIPSKYWFRLFEPQIFRDQFLIGQNKNICQPYCFNIRSNTYNPHARTITLFFLFHYLASLWPARTRWRVAFCTTRHPKTVCGLCESVTDRQQASGTLSLSLSVCVGLFEPFNLTTMSTESPSPLVLYYLNNSRSQRILWLLVSE